MTKIELEQKILELNKAYRTGEAIVSDLEYDTLVNQYQEKYPDSFETFKLKLFDDSEPVKSGKVKHKYPMGSLNKFKYDSGPLSLRNLLNAANKEFGTQIASYCLSPKLDGLSFILTYKDGKLVEAATRGDGVYGESKMDHAKHINLIPKTLLHKVDCIVRGELIIPIHTWSLIKETTKYTASRNAVAGFINMKIADPSLLNYVHFVAHGLIDLTNIPSDVEDLYKHNEDIDKNIYLRKGIGIGSRVDNLPMKVLELELLKTLGFDTVYNTYRTDIRSNIVNIDRVYETLLDNISKFRDNRMITEYETDGVVVCIPSNEYQNDKNRYYPVSSFAIKFNELFGEAEVDHIEYEVSKSGYLKPVAVFSKPIVLGESSITRCTLHNGSYVKSKNIIPGSLLYIVKSGDIIPYCQNVLYSPYIRSKQTLPKTCPCCGTALVWEGVELKCTNQSCPARTNNEVKDLLVKVGVKFISNATLIKFGISTFDALLSWKPKGKTKINEKFIEELKNLWNAPKEQLWAALNWEGISQKTWNKIFENMSLDKIIKDLSENKTEDFYKLSQTVMGIGNTTLEHIVKMFPKINNLFTKITTDHRYNNKDKVVEEVKSLILNGKRFCFSGSFSVKKDVLHKLCKLNGGIPVDSSGKNVRCTVVTNEDTSYMNKDNWTSKVKAAKKAGFSVINEQMFMDELEFKEI